MITHHRTLPGQKISFQLSVAPLLLSAANTQPITSRALTCWSISEPIYLAGLNNEDNVWTVQYVVDQGLLPSERVLFYKRKMLFWK